MGTIEWHGHHNPLELDALKAHALCVRAAEQCGGVAMPPLWYGEHREIQLLEVNDQPQVAREMRWPSEDFDRGYMGGRTVMEQANDYNDLLYHVLHQLQSLQFHAAIVICGHYPLQDYVRLRPTALVTLLLLSLPPAACGSGRFELTRPSVLRLLPGPVHRERLHAHRRHAGLRRNRGRLRRGLGG